MAISKMATVAAPLVKSSPILDAEEATAPLLISATYAEMDFVD